MLAARVAWERDSELGTEVGYQIRLEQYQLQRNPDSVVTEGVLLRQMVSDPMLPGIIGFDSSTSSMNGISTEISLLLVPWTFNSETRPDLKNRRYVGHARHGATEGISGSL